MKRSAIWDRPSPHFASLHAGYASHTPEEHRCPTTPSLAPGLIAACSTTPRSDFDALECGRGTIVIKTAPMQLLVGTIGGPGWSLKLKGALSYGVPIDALVQGVG